MSSFFPVLLLTGARQVGKTTFLSRLAGTGRSYITLDDVFLCSFAREDPRGFLERYKPPVLIDEIQYAPELFPYMKIRVDEMRLRHPEEAHGMYWLTGSQHFHLMRHVTESLAGRIGILEMYGLSENERLGRQSVPFLPTREFAEVSSPFDTVALFERIWQGSYPGVQEASPQLRDAFYASYVRTYLERDISALGKVTDLMRFLHFLRGVSARTGQLLNYSDLARDASISVMTAREWMSLLESSGIVRLVEPFSTNRAKRLVKTPKVYMMDTGLCAYLTQWPDARTLEAGGMSGAFFETWCVSQIIKSYCHQGKDARGIHFYRDSSRHEIDLVIEDGGTLYPIEFKKSSSPSPGDCHAFRYLEQLDCQVGMGAVVSMYPEVIQRLPNCRFIPATLI